jgi:hypothetical protein
MLHEVIGGSDRGLHINMILSYEWLRGAIPDKEIGESDRGLHINMILSYEWLPDRAGTQLQVSECDC